MKCMQKHTVAGLMLPLSVSLFSAVSVADEPAPAGKQEQRVEVRVESRSSSQSRNGDKPEVKTEGRIVVIGPDGVKKEYDLNAPEGRALILQMEGGLDALKVLDGQAATAPGDPAAAGAVAERVMIGVACEEAPLLLRKHLKLDNVGLVVLSVGDQSPAAEAKVEPDDILVSLNDRQLQTIEQLMEVVGGLEGQPARLQIIRSGSPMELSVTPRKMSVSQLSIDADAAKPGDPDLLRLHGRNQRLHRLFPGVIIDEQFPGDPEAMERMLKKLGTLAREEASRSAEQPAAPADGQPDVQQQLQQLREEIQELRRDLSKEKSPAAPQQR
ncbi:MAG: PDZ domain-containing protein [Planctomycetota bacterium]